MSTEILDEVLKVIFEYKRDRAAYLVAKVMEENIDPVGILDVFTMAIGEIGDRFGRGELWLTDLIGTAEAMKVVQVPIEKRVLNLGAKS